MRFQEKSKSPEKKERTTEKKKKNKKTHGVLKGEKEMLKSPRGKVLGNLTHRRAKKRGGCSWGGGKKEVLIILGESAIKTEKKNKVG